MKYPYLHGRKALGLSLCLALAVGLGGSGGSAAADSPTKPGSTMGPPVSSPQDPASPTAPPEIVKPGVLSPAMNERPIIPSKAELPDSAFKKLDVGNKGYVTKNDVRDLEGFDKVFDTADPKHTGKLTAAQFKKAWSDYTAGSP